MKMKRMTSIVLTICILLSMLVLPAQAAGECLKADKTSLKPGDTFTLSYVIPNSVSNVDAITIEIGFDKDKFEAKSITYADIAPLVRDTNHTVTQANANGKFRGEWSSNDETFETATTAANLQLFEATFTVKEAAAAGDADFTVDVLEVFDDVATDLSSSAGATKTKATVNIVAVLTGDQTITMDTRPAAGAATSTVAASGTNFTVNFEDWKQGSASVSTFEAEKPYTATGTLTANTGYVFAEGATVKLSGAAENESVEGADRSPDGKTLTFTYKYTTPGLPAYEGTAADAPTLNTKAGGNVTLNTVAVSGEEVEYGWSHENNKATAGNWQGSTDFAGLTAGDYYFFARVKAKAGTHSGGGVSDASAKITVFAAPRINGYGSLDSLMFDTDVDVAPDATVPAGLATTNPYSITGTLPAGLDFDEATGKITGKPTTVSATGGSVTITVTDKEGIVSAAYPLSYGAVAKQANTMTSVTQANVEYGTAVNPSVNACNGTTPTYQYKVRGAGDDTYVATKPTAVGEYTVKASSTGHATVADAVVTADFAITQKTLTNLGFTGVTVTKVYDGTTSAGAVGGSAITFDGKVGTDDVSIKAVAGEYIEANAGTGKTVTLTLSLDGAAKDNYKLASYTQDINTAAITAADQTITSSYTTETNAYSLTKGGNTVDLTTLAATDATGNSLSFTVAEGGSYASIQSDGKTLKSTASTGTVKITVSADAYDAGGTADKEYNVATNITIYVKVVSKLDAGVAIEDASTSTTYGTNVTITATKSDSVNGGTWSWEYPGDTFEAVGATDTATIVLKPLKATAAAATVTAKYESDTHLGSDSISVTVNPKELTAADLEFTDTTITKPYNGDTTSTATVKVLDSAKVNAGDALPTVTGSAVYNSANVTTATKVTFTTTESSNTNYKVPAGLIKEHDASITKADSSVATAPTGKPGLKYTGSAQALVNAGAADGGTMQYALSADGSYSDAIPTGTNADSYTVYYKVKGDANHNDMAAAGPVNVTIGKATPTVVPPTGKASLTYTGNALELIDAGSTTGGTLQYKVGTGEYGTAIPTGIDAAGYTVSYRVVGDSNYNDVAEASLSTITITKGTLGGSNASKKIRFNDTAEKSYTPADFGLTLEGTFALNGSVTDSGSVLADTYPKYDSDIKVQLKSALSLATPAQTITIPVTFTPTNTNWNPKNYTLTITLDSKHNVDGDITFADGELTYTGSGLTYETATITGVSGGTWTYTYTVGTGTLDGSGKPLTVGTYTVKAEYEDGDNLGEKTATLTVKPKPITVPAADTTVYTYTGSAQTYQIAASSDYAVTGETQTNANETGYTVTVSLTDPTNTAWADDTTANKTYTFIIKKATPTGTPAYTAITTSGKTLADAALAVGSIDPAGGSIVWDVADTTTVTANTAYNWTYTPAAADQANYNNLTGSITPYVVSYSSGGGGGVSTYAISVDSAKNGTVTVSPKNAAKGTTVTITVKPDKGFELDTLKVVDKNGDKVKVTEKNGKYTFTMPASKVTVKATFAEIVVAPENPFVDVAESAYYYDAVLWAAENGITGGTDATHFSPNATCTRAQIVTFLWRAAGSPEPTTANSFADVPADSYYAKAVAWAVEQGITTGTGDGKFSPNAPCTRAQSVTFLWRSQKSPASDSVNPFADVAAGTYYNNAVLWAAENGITGGTSATTFSPNNDCTRAQIVTFLFRLLGE